MTMSRNTTLSDEASTIDHQDLPGYKVSALEEVQEGGDHVRGVAQAPERSGTSKARPFLLRVILRNQHRPWGYCVHRYIRGKAQGEHLGEHDYSGFADRMGSKAGPWLQAGEIREIDHLPSRGS